MYPLRLLGLFALGCSMALAVSASAPAGNKKDDVDVVGVITEVHRDKDPKDKDIGWIAVRKANKDSVKIIVMKSTDIVRNGKMIEFKALDKGDIVGVHTKKGNVADKIVIRKDK